MKSTNHKYLSDFRNCKKKFRSNESIINILYVHTTRVILPIKINEDNLEKHILAETDI